MVSKPVVFISSTSDLRAARELVGTTLYSMGYEPVWQDIEATDGGELLEVLRQRITPCQLMIQLVGQRYGAEPPHSTPEFGRVSYTQFEALYAEMLGRKVIYNFIDPAFPSEASAPESEERGALQTAYRQRIKDANKLRQSNIATVQGLELSVRRITDELAAVRKQSDARYRRIAWLTAASVAAALIGVAIVLAAFHILHSRQAEQSAKIDQQSTKAAEQSNQLDRIEKLLVAQKQANPQSAPVLSRADQTILDQAKNQDNLKTKATASVLQPDSNTDALLAQLQGQHDEQAFDLAMLRGKRWFFDKSSEYDKAIPFFEQAVSLRPDSWEARNFAAISHTYASLGDTAAHQKRAIEINEQTLSAVKPDSYEWATTQINLGIAWQNMATDAQDENLRKAIKAYEAALTVFTRDTSPAEWAMAQNNLAAAWSKTLAGDLAENRRKAIAAYEAASTVFTRDSQPFMWAATQNNLAQSWATMPTGDQAANLQKAITAYEGALTVYTHDAHPVEWAITQNNLAVAWRDMPAADRTENLRKAIASFEAALTVRTREARPAEWAMTQNNLGTAWTDMPHDDQNLHNAVKAFEAALTIYTRDTHPVEWALAQYNLGNAWVEMPSGNAADNVRRAIDAYEASLTARTQSARPLEWAQSQFALAGAWVNLSTGDRRENVRKAIAANEAALTVNTRNARPLQWAPTQINLGADWGMLSEVPGEDRCNELRQAIAHEKAALTLTPGFPGQNQALSTLRYARKQYESSNCAAKIPFDEIQPAR